MSNWAVLHPIYTTSDVIIQCAKRRFSQLQRTSIALTDMVLQWDNSCPHIYRKKNYLFEAGEDPAAKAEPIHALLEHLRLISIQNSEVWALLKTLNQLRDSYTIEHRKESWKSCGTIVILIR